MLTEINGNIDATYPIITGELTGYLGPIGTVTASADNSVGTPHVIVTQTPTPDGLDIDFAFKEMGIPGLDLTVEQDLTEEQQQTARENIDAQEVLIFDAAPTSGSSNPVTSAGIYAADEDLKDYVDDSINRSSAFFRGNFATKADLLAVAWQTTDPDAPNFVSNNDYAFVAADESHSGESWRYIYVLEEGGSDNGWTAQYRVNESPFTVEQLAAINSGITANDVTKLGGIEPGAQVNTVTGVKGDAEANYRTGNINITKANIGLGNVDNTSDANKPVSTAQQAAIEAATKALYDVKSAGPAAIVSIHDAEAIPLKSLVASITPLQDLHGYDNPWPAGGGKNKLDSSGFVSKTTWTSTSITLKPNTVYTASSNCLSANVIFYVRKTGGTAQQVYNNQPITITTGEDGVIGLQYRVTDASFNILSYYYQIEEGSTATDYAPYSNICPIEGWTGAKITRTGINIWDEEWEEGTIDGDGNKASATDRIRSKYYIPAKAESTYYFHVTNPTYYATTMQVGICFYDNNKTYISTTGTAVNRTFTTPANTYYLKFYTGGSGRTSHPVYQNDFSINYPSTDTSYHSGTDNKTVNIDWTDEAGTVYGGTLTYIGGGKYSLQPNKKYYDGATLDWNYSSAQATFWTELGDVITPTAGVTEGVISSNYATTLAAAFNAGGWGAKDDYSVGLSTSSPTRLCVKDSRYTDAASFKTAVTGVQFIYDLATLPDPIILTAEDVKTLLGDNNIFADCGDVAIEYETGTVAVALADLYEKFAAQIGA